MTDMTRTTPAETEHALITGLLDILTRPLDRMHRQQDLITVTAALLAAAGTLTGERGVVIGTTLCMTLLFWDVFRNVSYNSYRQLCTWADNAGESLDRLEVTTASLQEIDATLSLPHQKYLTLPSSLLGLIPVCSLLGLNPAAAAALCLLYSAAVITTGRAGQQSIRLTLHALAVKSALAERGDRPDWRALPGAETRGVRHLH